MIDSTFKRTFQHKTNDELTAIVKDAESYIDEARLTAIQMLKERGADVTLYQTTEANLSTAITKQKEQKAEEKAKEVIAFLEKEAKVPQLYSKTLILTFCILFSTLFGAALLAYNMKVSGKKQGFTQVILFAVFYVLGGVLVSLAFQSDMSTLFLNVISGFILTEYYWNKYLGATVKYVKKSWVKPTLISLVIVFIFMGILWYMLGAPTDMATFMETMKNYK